MINCRKNLVGLSVSWTHSIFFFHNTRTLWPFLSVTHTHNKHTRARTHTHTHSLSLSHTHTNTNAKTHKHRQTASYYVFLHLSLSHTYSFPLSIPICLSQTHTPKLFYLISFYLSFSNTLISSFYDCHSIL